MTIESARSTVDPAPSAISGAVSGDRVVSARMEDAVARPLVDELGREYDERYGSFFGEPASAEMARYPSEHFTPEHGGAFLLIVRDGVAVAGGAYKRFDERTAELKRIWASSAHRRQGLARRILLALEDEARARGYDRVYLTTGPRQPEAKALYIATGWTPLFDTALSPDEVVIHGFAKSLDGSALDVDGIRAAHEESLRAH